MAANTYSLSTRIHTGKGIWQGLCPLATTLAILKISVLYLICSQAVSSAASTISTNYYEDPQPLRKEISIRGAKKIVSELYADKHAWDIVLQNIEKGQRSWLKAAVALHQGTDAGSSEMLDSAIGNALEHAPQNVLSITPQHFKLEFICSAPDVDDTRYDSYDLAMKAIEKRQEQIKTIKDPRLITAVDKCLSLLEHAKGSVAEFYQIKKEPQ